MIFVVDIGNTHIHLGLFTRGALQASWRLSTDPRRTVDEFALQFKSLLSDEIVLAGVIISSVVPRLTERIVASLKPLTVQEPMILTAETEIGIVNGYDHPNEVGMDRLANAAGGFLLHGAPLLILDFGTAITLEYLAPPDVEGGRPIYAGGAILPGLDMAAEALARGTAKLPQVEIADPGVVIGRTMVHSIQSGLVHGYIGGIGSLVDRARAQIGRRVKVVATGGNAEQFHSIMPFVDAVEPVLTLFGLRQIYGINHGCALPGRDR
jgi:type III pantothenate kinase